MNSYDFRNATGANVNMPFQSEESLPDVMAKIGINARKAASELSIASTEQKNNALAAIAKKLLEKKQYILEQNKIDIEEANAKNARASIIDRLKLDDARIDGIAQSVIKIVDLADPVGVVLDQWSRPNGMEIKRVSTPLGVIGMIYEARPNVTVDAAALCLKSGNAVILRSGSNSFYSSKALAEIISEALVDCGMNPLVVQFVPTTDRAAVGLILQGLNNCIDVVIPRGGRSLVERVQEEARVPVFSHLDGVCHVYIDADADIDTAVKISVNAKMRRTGICGAVETILVYKAIADEVLPLICGTLFAQGCEIRGDEKARRIVGGMENATEDDWYTEYLDAIVSVKVVDSLDEAIAHINKYGSGHTDCIVTLNDENASRFLNEVDSAIVMHNVSTQFADGGEFGMGAEIGISTGRFHARGPIGMQQLTVMKYQVVGSGQCRAV